MKFVETPLKGAYVIELNPFEDHRGMFTRLFCKTEFKEIAHKKEIVQINHSLTKMKGSIRGMHFQIPPKSECKIIKCLQGSVLDVIIDLREGSRTFLNYHMEELSRENQKSIYIPEGFAHGFQTLKENSELIYFHTEYYDKEFERAIRYNDPKIGIDWPLDATDISDKDKNHELLDAKFTGLKI
ncbi:MAG: dTDP-4-dehydrorhamnose 3,5-epimerase [Candidatus Heimdallarchaeota archaeon]